MQYNNIETIASSAEILVRQFTLKYGEIVPWHHHSHVKDVTICISGRICIELEDTTSIKLRPGMRYDIEPNVRHKVINIGKGNSVYFLVQHGGEYDFVKQV
jgi:quercetin dioxygenase-like cupin family protein